MGIPLVGYQLTPVHPARPEQSRAAAGAEVAFETHSGRETDLRRSSSVEKSQPGPSKEEAASAGSRTGPTAR